MIRKDKPRKTGFLPAKYGAFDCETEGLYGDAVLICLILNDGSKHVFKGKTCVSDFIKEVTKSKYRNYVLFAHNLEFDLEKTFGAKFGNSLENKRFSLLMSGSRLISATYYFDEEKRNKLSLWDSYNLIPDKLEQIGEDLGFKKFSLPDKFKTGEKITQITDDDIKYCLRDCEIIFKILETYKVLIGGYETKLKMTAASNAKAIWKAIYFKNRDESDRVIFVYDKKDEVFRKSYLGGRVEAFILGYNEKTLYKYDINAMYAYIMSDNKFPNPNELKQRPKSLSCDPVTADDLISIMEVEEGCAKISYSPPKDLLYPVLPTREDRLMFTVKDNTDQYNFPEIRLALKMGYKITKVHWTLSSIPICSPFAEYVKKFSNLKEKYSSDGKDSLAKLSKLLGNSLYGKFGQRNDIEDRYMEEEPGIGIPFKTVGKIFMLVSVEKERANETVVCWASYVTSYARTLIYSYFPKIGLYYCDTDCIVTDKPLPSKLVDKFNMGMMKLEHTITKANFVAAKDYAIEGYNHKKEKTEEIKKRKGISKKYAELIPIETYHAPHSVFYPKAMKIKTALRKEKSTYSKEDIHKTLSPNSKRFILDNGLTVPFGYAQTLKIVTSNTI